MIYYIPWGDNKTASSRLRVHNIIPHLGVEVKIGAPDNYENGDVLIIQKTPQRKELEKAQKQGAMVIYDIDDNYLSVPEYTMMGKLADKVTVGAPYMQKFIKGSNYIPDSLDWDGTVKEDYGFGSIVGWTGYGNNSVYLNDVKLPEEFTLRLITSPDWPQHYKGKAESRVWNLETVDRYLSECDLSIYALPNQEFENSKGMHKLLKSWAIGLPCYVSPMPDYVRAIEEAGVSKEYLITDWSKLKNIGFDEKCREYAMQYKAEEMAKLWKKVIGI